MKQREKKYWILYNSKRSWCKMRMREFIRQNRKELESCIRSSDYTGSLSIADIEQWINNDEGLYNWARRSGVRI